VDPSLIAQSLNSFIMGVTNRAESTGDRAEPYSTLTSASLRSDTKVFHMFHVYDVDLPTRYDANKFTMSSRNPCFQRIAIRASWEELSDIKSDNASLETLSPSCRDKMCEI